MLQYEHVNKEKTLGKIIQYLHVGLPDMQLTARGQSATGFGVMRFMVTAGACHNLDIKL